MLTIFINEPNKIFRKYPDPSGLDIYQIIVCYCLDA